MLKSILLVALQHPSNIELLDQLSKENFSTIYVNKMADAISVLKSKTPDVILIDTENSNEIACYELCYVVKSRMKLNNPLVIIFSAKHDMLLEIQAFRAGADDYLVKPIYPKALIERIKTRLQEPKETITINTDNTDTDNIQIDKESHSVFLGNQSLNLSRKEFELLYLMASNPGKIFKRDELLTKIWKKQYSSRDRTVDVHILHLRRKLGNKYIQTQKGVGYRFYIS